MSDTLPDMIEGEIVRGLPVGAWPAARAIVARVIAAKDAEIAGLRERLEKAMSFVPHPACMSGYGDPIAPEESQAMIRQSAELYGVNLEFALAARGGDGG